MKNSNVGKIFNLNLCYLCCAYIWNLSLKYYVKFELRIQIEEWFSCFFFSSKSDSLTEFGDNLEDGSIELAEKNSDESSPSPSDSSNNVDETTYTAADLGYYLKNF